MKKNGCVKVLQVTIGDGSYGGVASFLYSYYTYIDHSKVHFDFLYCGENSMQSKADTSILSDSKITTLHIMKSCNNGISEYRKLIKALRAYFEINEYDVIHINTSNVYVSSCVCFALKGKAKLICHSHNTKATVLYGSKVKRFIKSVMKLPCRNYILKKSNYYFACSVAAGYNLFGKKAIKSNKFKLINNAIDISHYIYNSEVRKNVRNTNKLIFGHVGRLTRQKNPEFLVEVFNEIHKLNINTVLWMIGEGELYDKVSERIKELDLEDCVVLWGRRTDVADLMQGMDVFLLPSLYEGLSIVAIEAQASGLPIFASDSISKEHKITDLVHFLSLKIGAVNWAKAIVETIESIPPRRNMYAEINNAGYEIVQAAKLMEKLYLTID